MQQYAQIIVDITSEKLDRTFTYRIPEALAGQITPGVQVLFPFGNGNRQQKGFVLDITDQPSYDPAKIKELDGHCARGGAGGRGTYCPGRPGSGRPTAPP